MRDYQKRIKDLMVEHPRLALFVDMGCGKTLTTLKALEQIKGKTLLIAPIRVCETVWREEATKWNIRLSFSLLRGTPKERINALKLDTDVYLINPELLGWLFHQRELPEFNTLVIDESSLFKSSKTERFKILKRQLKSFERRYILTGTPSPNSYTDLWSQIGILDNGKRLGTAFGRFRDLYFESDYLGFTWTIRQGAKEKIETLLTDIVVRLDAKEYLEIPELTEIDVEVNLSPAELGQYQKFAKEMITDFGDQKLTALSAGALYAKLSQLANGMVYLEEGVVHTLHKRKLETLVEIVETINSPVIITYKYIHERDEIMKLFPKAVLFNKGDSKKHIEDWNAGKIDQLLIHPKSGGHGINCQEGGHHIIWFGMVSSLEEYLQTNKRLHRSGQLKPVIVYRLISKETVDEKIAKTLSCKNDMQEGFLSAMKKTLLQIRDIS